LGYLEKGYEEKWFYFKTQVWSLRMSLQCWRQQVSASSLFGCGHDSQKFGSQRELSKTGPVLQPSRLESKGYGPQMVTLSCKKLPECTLDLEFPLMRIDFRLNRKYVEN
jgi:hypothetical protein